MLASTCSPNFVAGTSVCCYRRRSWPKRAYLIDRLGGPQREVEFLEGVADGGFEPVDFTARDYRRIAELADQYADMRLGTTDASVVALAERLQVTEVATLDHRHFAAIRPRHVKALTLLPQNRLTPSTFHIQGC